MRKKKKQGYSITQHAVERYIERFEPSLTFDEALEKLEGFAQQASATRHKTVSGHVVWKVDDVRLVFKPAREDGKLLCVTVLSTAEWEKYRKGTGTQKSDAPGGLAALQAYLGMEESE